MGDLEEGLLRPRSVSYFALCGIVLTNAAKVFVVGVSWSVMKTTDSALLGHVGTKYLVASALADLWMSSTSSLILGGVVSVLAAQAVGAKDPKLAGVWLQVALLVSLFLLIPIGLSWLFTGDVMLAFGKGQDIAAICGLYSQLMCVALVGRVIVSSLTQFLYAIQEFSVPVRASSVAMVVNLVFGVFFVLGWPLKNWHGFGFVACPLVTAAAEYTMLFINIGYMWRHGIKEYWPGWSLSHITTTRLWTYLKLFVPSALSISSDFWRMAVMGVMSATIGDDEVGVFNVSYRVMWLSLIFVGSVAQAVGVLMSNSVGANNVPEAKRACVIGGVLCGIVLAVVSVVVILYPRIIFSIFTEDPFMLQLFGDSASPFCAMLIFMNLAVYLERFPLAFSKMRAVFIIGLIGSWGFQVPFTFLCITFWRKDLTGLYTGGFIGYLAVCTTYLLYFKLTDWDRAAAKVRETAAKNQMDENKDA